MEPPRRRQNRSCDQCRASKRRCVQADESVLGHPQCRTCARLDRRCTFNFVHHHRTPKQKQTFVISDTDPLATQFTGAPLFDDLTSQGAPYLIGTMEWEVPDGVDATLASSVMSPPFYDISAIDFTNWMTIPNDSLDGPWEAASIAQDSVVAQTSTVPRNTISADSSLPPTSSGTSFGSTLTPVQTVETRAVHNSPLDLLNSTMNIRLENEYLALIFHSLTIALYVRYLSPPSNGLTNGSRLCEISFEQSGQQLLHTTHNPGSESIEGVQNLQPTSSASQCEMDSSTCIEPSRLQNDVAKAGTIGVRAYKVTMIGVALFLDHFGPIYGFHRSKLEKREDEAVLAATVRAFLLANAPISRSTSDQCDDTSTNFDNAWLDAYHHLTESMTRRSFTLAYSAFTFDLLPVPLSLSFDSQFSEGKERLLRRSVQQLQGLLSIVASFCGRLSGNSKYRSLLEACKRTMEWHAYVRDTISAFTNGSRCIMDDNLLNSNGYTAHSSRTVTDSLLMQEETFREKCQQMSCRLFFFYRDIVRIRACVNEAQTDSTAAFERIHEAVSHVRAALDSIRESWVHACLDQFAQLSPTSQLSFGFIILYWSLGVLKVYEVLQSTTNLAVTGISDLWRIARESRSRAVTLHAKIMKVIMHNANDDGLPVLEGTSFKLPFMAHHANTTLLTLALTTAIEHTIDMLLAGEIEADGDWLQLSMWCLFSLEHSASGRSSVRPALDRLIHRYGDIILECWSGREELLGCGK